MPSKPVPWIFGLGSSLLLLCSSPVGATGPPEDGADADEILEAVGLFKSTIDSSSIERGDSGVEDPEADVLEDDEDGDGQPDAHRGEPFVAPIPFRSPSIGWGGALAAGYIFRIDPEDGDSPPSTVSAAGFGTENESFGGVLSGRFHIAEDRWRVTSVAAFAHVNYDFFGIGSDAGDRGDKIEIESDTLMGRLRALRRLPESFRVLGVPVYMGPGVRISWTENSLSGSNLPPGISQSELDETHIGFGVHLQRDARDDTFYPKEGSLSDFGFEFFEDALGSDFDYRVWDVSYSRYDELWEEGILASRAFGRFTDGDVPFTDLSQHDLRGYERGRYRDKMHMAGELELRQHIFWRIGGAVFAGLGQVAPAIDDFSSDKLLWSVGFGLRFRLTEQNRMNYRTDVAWGRDGFEFYFSITEAF